jgi:hypothetical protein
VKQLKINGMLMRNKNWAVSAGSTTVIIGFEITEFIP